MSDAWSNLPSDPESSWKDFEGPMMDAPAPPKTEPTKTVLVDVAAGVEKPQTYIEAAEKKERPKMSQVSAPVDIYEPGFRSDLYSAMKDYFRKIRATKDRNAEIRRKFGWEK